jgi:hypothetical protein
MIGPIFAKMSEEMPDVEFVGVDVDEAEDIAAGKCTTSASWYCSYWLQWSLHRILHVPQLTLSILFVCLFVLNRVRHPCHAYLSLLQGWGEGRRNAGC